MDKNIIVELNRKGDHSSIEQAVKGGYLTTDSEFLKTDLRGGACCVTALITGGNLVVSNAGDCRAVSSKNGVAEALTSDHCPSREDERERIEMSVSSLVCALGLVFGHVDGLLCLGLMSFAVSGRFC